MSILKSFVVAIVLATTVVACIDSPTAPSDFAPYSQVDLLIGTGATAVVGTQVSVRYTGWLYDASKTDHKGLMFDTTDATSIAFTFLLGTGQVIPGWDQGIPGMLVGGQRRLVIPPSLGYGDVRRSKIPANSTLIFEIEVLSVP